MAMFQPEMATTWLDAGRRECRSDLAIDAVAQADQDAGRQAGLRLGEDRARAVAGGLTDALQRSRRIRAALDRLRAGGERAPRRRSARDTGRTTSPVGGGSARRRHAVAGRRHPGSAGRVAATVNTGGVRGDRPERRGLLAVARRSDGDYHESSTGRVRRARRLRRRTGAARSRQRPRSGRPHERDQPGRESTAPRHEDRRTSAAPRCDHRDRRSSRGPGQGARPRRIRRPASRCGARSADRRRGP